MQIGFTQPTTVTSTDLVKPGMSVTADLVTQADQNVVAVPNSAVHAQGTTSYVLEPATPLSATDLASAATGIELSGGTKMVTVTTGISNDTETEITSGLNPGDQYITQTITTSGTTSAGSTAAAGGTNALRALGGGAGAFGGGGGFTGGAVRVTGGGGGAARTGAGG